ncbi:MAG TPA: transcription-repair coupling factor, partial [Acidimicrobiales bacterium]|nr:transcription-repair coupling factor [Acidimicrobiales bacterium]
MTVAESLAPTDDLRHLPTVAREEPGLLAVLGRKDAVLAVPEPARALVVAGLAARSTRRPIVVATAATADAERLVNDLQALLGADAVEHFPAWETLPFERVSPAIETMGRRLTTLHRLGAGRDDPAQLPDVVVTSVRALIQRLAPGVEDIEPVCITKGDEVDIE